MGEIISAPAGLPFLKSGGGAGGPIPSTTITPPKADIFVGGKGGGAESAPYDPNQSSAQAGS